MREAPGEFAERHHSCLNVKRATERVLVRLLIGTGWPLNEFTTTDLDELAGAFRRCADAKGNASTWAIDRTLICAAHRVLFHVGVLDTPPPGPRQRSGLSGHYSGIPERAVHDLFSETSVECGWAAFGQSTAGTQLAHHFGRAPAHPIIAHNASGLCRNVFGVARRGLSPH